eukprot:Amastigsp_a175813_123.p2 type:complete len:124 gc:universal Amastigsp_a175813_123:1328-1699(+)
MEFQKEDKLAIFDVQALRMLRLNDVVEKLDRAVVLRTTWAVIVEHAPQRPQSLANDCAAPAAVAAPPRATPRATPRPRPRPRPRPKAKTMKSANKGAVNTQASSQRQGQRQDKVKKRAQTSEP